MNNKLMTADDFQRLGKYGTEITQAVGDFATKRRLQFSPYHGGMANWEISDPDVAEGITREIQVAASMWQGEITLSFVFTILVCKDGKRWIPMEAYHFENPLDGYEFGPNFSNLLFGRSLLMAWEGATTLKGKPDSIKLVPVP